VRASAVIALLLFALPAWAQSPSPGRRPRATLAADLLVPLSHDFGSGAPGYGASVGLLSDLTVAVIQPRLGFQLSPGTRGAYVLDFNADVGGAWAPIAGPVTPLLGAGVGGRWLRVRGETQVTRAGEVITRTVRTWEQSSHLGFGWYARVGALFFRDAPMGLLLTADYTMAIFGDGLRPQALLVSLGMVL
jgi:hypothetical protein